MRRAYRPLRLRANRRRGSPVHHLVVRRSPTPFSGLPLGTEKMPAGYCTRVPKSGTANVRHSWSPIVETACSQVTQESGTAAMAAETRNLTTFDMSARPSFSFAGPAMSSPGVPENVTKAQKGCGHSEQKKQTEQKKTRGLRSSPLGSRQRRGAARLGMNA